MTELERHLMIERYLVENRTSRNKLARKVGCDRSWITLVLKHGARPSKRLRDALLAQGVPEELLAPARPDRPDRTDGTDRTDRPAKLERLDNLDRPDRPAKSGGPGGPAGIAGDDNKPEDAARPDDAAPEHAANR
ncbi:hypothetical protein [Desulfocurvibacter africanus]|uniref:hypothetical protein n=1 Tax=Desulfocurvibacter africanus TaxID=873 RepID=UPI0002D4DEC3|nr:hypothetical protein [Desulfocurvibacter africanus]